MNHKFKIEHSIYVMGMFIAVVGIMFLLVRSDAALKFKYFNDSAEKTVLKQEVQEGQSIPSYLLLTGPDSPDVQKALEKRLELMGKNVVIRSIASIKSETDLIGYTGVVIATEELDRTKETEAMLRFVKNGGSLFLAVRPLPGSVLSQLSESLGLVEIGPLVETAGIHLERPFFKESAETVFLAESIVNSSLAVQLSGKVDLFASSSAGIPLLWKTDYGEGTFTVFNGTMFTSMTEQALFVKGIQQASDHFIMPIVNARVTELSGFPFLVPDGKDFSQAYTNRDYYHSVIWPELQRIESMYDLNYTASYRAPEKTGHSLEDTLKELQFYSRELLRMGGEVAIHHVGSGKDGQPLNSLEKTLLHIQETLPDYPVRSAVSSVPGSDAGLLENISTMLVPGASISQIGDATILPKTLEESGSTESNKWKLFNEVALNGFYAHSLNPYNFFEEGDVEEKMAAFADFHRQSNSQFPWIRPLTLTQAGEAAFAYIHGSLYEEQKGDTLIFNATTMKEKVSSSYYFSTNRTILETENCKFTNIGEDLYLVEAEELTFSIVLGGLQ